MPAPDHSGQEPQSAGAVLMVRPANFGFNSQTAPSNAFQQASVPLAGGEALPLAQREFDVLAQALQRAGVDVLVADDTPQPVKPDAVFPNNWVSFHADGTVVLYPMMAPNRRPERREDLLERVIQEGRYRVSRKVDLIHREADGKFLEGTGSLVLDRAHHIAYASVSPRTDLDVLGEFAQILDYDLVTFDSRDTAAQPVYHTNVLMAIGTHFAVVCGAAIAESRHRDAVCGRLRSSGHDIIEISLPQMQDFAANLLELQTFGGPVVALSTTAWDSLGPAQRRVLESHATPIPVSIPTIERLGGGGVRCMLAEVHLPKRQ